MDPSPKSPDPVMARSSELASSATRTGSPRSSRRPKALLSAEARPETILGEIRAYLAQGRFRTAQKLAREAAAEFPRDTEIRTMNRGLNEWTATTRPSDEPDRTEEFEWLRDPPASARGKWVALLGREMVASAETLVEVMKSLESMNLPMIPLVHRID